MRALVATMIVLALALSGCAEKKKDDDESDSSSTSHSGTDSGGVGGNVSSNHPPAATMTANGTADAPLNVTFLLNATDSDGDAMAWTLAFGDGASANGTFAGALNRTLLAGPQLANATHLYAAGGAYNATLTVSDGKATTNVTLKLNLTAGTPFEQFVAEGTPDLPCPQCSNAGANTGVGYRAGINELDSFFVDLPEGAAGQPFTLVSSEGDPDMVFRDSCDGGAAVGDTFLADGPESGTVPDGAKCALMWEPEGAGSTITLTIG